MSYWTALAPRVEDYNSVAGKAIAAGFGQIIKGIFLCSNAYASQVQKGGAFIRSRLSKTTAAAADHEKKKSNHGKISPSTKRNIRRWMGRILTFLFCFSTEQLGPCSTKKLNWISNLLLACMQGEKSVKDDRKYERECAKGVDHSKRCRDCTGGWLQGWKEVLQHVAWRCPSCFIGCFQYGNISPIAPLQQL